MPIARRSAAAEHDLQTIAYHVAFIDRNPLAADQIIDDLIGAAERLAELSTVSIMGTAAPELGNGIRLFHCQRWVIIFRYASHGIDVLRFVDGKQDYMAWKLD